MPKCAFINKFNRADLAAGLTRPLNRLASRFSLIAPEFMKGMTNAKIKALCEQILVPELETALRRYTASPQLIKDFVDVIDRHFTGLAAAIDDEMFRVHDKLDSIIALLENDER